MKHIIIAAAIIVCAAACQRAVVPAATPVVNTEIRNANGQLFLAGHASPSVLHWPNYKDWFDQSYNSYSVDSSAARRLQTLLKGKRMDIFLGSWCGDSRREVPRMLKLLAFAGLDTNQVALVFVDNSSQNYKQSPQHEERGRNIHHVPTFIVYDGKKEMGRIIESPMVSLEKDLVAILDRSGYTPNYQAITWWQTHVGQRESPMEEPAIVAVASQLRSSVKHYGEFAAYANMLQAAAHPAEALNVFRLNAMLYPESSNAFNSLGEALANAGRKTEAVSAFEKVLVLKPGDENAKKRIAELKL